MVLKNKYDVLVLPNDYKNNGYYASLVWWPNICTTQNATSHWNVAKYAVNCFSLIRCLMYGLRMRGNK